MARCRAGGSVAGEASAMCVWVCNSVSGATLGAHALLCTLRATRPHSGKHGTPHTGTPSRLPECVTDILRGGVAGTDGFELVEARACRQSSGDAAGEPDVDGG